MARLLVLVALLALAGPALASPSDPPAATKRRLKFMQHSKIQADVSSAERALRARAQPVKGAGHPPKGAGHLLGSDAAEEHSVLKGAGSATKSSGSAVKGASAGSATKTNVNAVKGASSATKSNVPSVKSAGSATKSNVPAVKGAGSTINSNGRQLKGVAEGGEGAGVRADLHPKLPASGPEPLLAAKKGGDQTATNEPSETNARDTDVTVSSKGSEHNGKQTSEVKSQLTNDKVDESIIKDKLHKAANVLKPILTQSKDRNFMQLGNKRVAPNVHGEQSKTIAKQKSGDEGKKGEKTDDSRAKKVQISGAHFKAEKNIIPPMKKEKNVELTSELSTSKNANNNISKNVGIKKKNQVSSKNVNQVNVKKSAKGSIQNKNTKLVQNFRKSGAKPVTHDVPHKKTPKSVEGQFESTLVGRNNKAKDVGTKNPPHDVPNLDERASKVQSEPQDQTVDSEIISKKGSGNEKYKYIHSKNKEKTSSESDKIKENDKSKASLKKGIKEIKNPLLVHRLREMSKKSKLAAADKQKSLPRRKKQLLAPVHAEAVAEGGRVPVDMAFKDAVKRRRRLNKHSDTVAVIAIFLISSVTFMTILGVYYKKISFTRQRYGHHMPLSTHDDDYVLFNRDTQYDSWAKIPAYYP